MSRNKLPNARNETLTLRLSKKDKQTLYMVANNKGVTLSNLIYEFLAPILGEKNVKPNKSRTAS